MVEEVAEVKERLQRSREMREVWRRKKATIIKENTITNSLGGPSMYVCHARRRERERERVIIKESGKKGLKLR